jgi:hypothetical protein
MRSWQALASGATSPSAQWVCQPGLAPRLLVAMQSLMQALTERTHLYIGACHRRSLHVERHHRSTTTHSRLPTTPPSDTASATERKRGGVKLDKRTTYLERGAGFGRESHWSGKSIAPQGSSFSARFRSILDTGRATCLSSHLVWWSDPTSFPETLF